MKKKRRRGKNLNVEFYFESLQVSEILIKIFYYNTLNFIYTYMLLITCALAYLFVSANSCERLSIIYKYVAADGMQNE